MTGGFSFWTLIGQSRDASKVFLLFSFPTDKTLASSKKSPRTSYPNVSHVRQSPMYVSVYICKRCSKEKKNPTSTEVSRKYIGNPGAWEADVHRRSRDS